MIPCRPLPDRFTGRNKSWIAWSEKDSIRIMDLICEKYKESMPAEKAVCKRPKEYCKFRTSCIIHFRDDTDNRDNPAITTYEEDGMVSLRFEKGDGLLPAIVQDYRTKEVLMLAYINDLAWEKTLETGRAHYWSRSRNKLWLKGETSGHQQVVKNILVDCDEDTVIYQVEQLGGAACHTGHRSCFFRKVSGKELETFDEPVFNPEEVYKK